MASAKGSIPAGRDYRVLHRAVFVVTVVDGGGRGETLVGTFFDEALAEAVKNKPRYGGHGRVRRKDVVLLESLDNAYYDLSNAGSVVVLTEDPEDAHERALAKLTDHDRQVLGLL